MFSGETKSKEGIREGKKYEDEVLHRVEREIIDIIREGKRSGKLKGTMRDEIANVIRLYSEKYGGD